MTAGAGDGEAKALGAEGAGDGGGGARAFENEGSGDAAGEGAAGEEVADPAEVAFAFFADVGGEEDGDGRDEFGVTEGGGEGEQGREASGVVTGAGGEDARAVFGGGAGGAGGEDSVEVGREEEHGLVGVGAGGGEFGEGIAEVIEAGIAETEGGEVLEYDGGASGLGEGRGGDADELEQPLANLGLVKMEPAEGAMHRWRSGEREDAALGAGCPGGDGGGHA